MKKTILSVLIIFFSFPILVNAKDNNITITYDVKAEITFNNQNIVINEKISAGDKLLEPSHIEMEGYTFLGWFDGEHKWDFDNDVVNNHTTLIAKYEKNDNNDIKENNSYKDSKDETFLPNTGDNINLFIILLIINAIGFIIFVIYEKIVKIKS